MESTDNHILETVTLDLRPVLNLIAGDILRIACHIVRGIGIRALGTNGSHQLVVLIGDEVLGSELTHGVNLMISLSACLRVCESAIGLITQFDLCQKRSLRLSIVSTELFGALKHQVLQVMSQSCCLCGVILRTCTYSDIRLNPRLLVIHREIHLQPIVQGIYPRLHHIPRHRDILTRH